MTAPLSRPAAPAPAVQQLGAAVLVQGEALPRLVFALSRAVDDRRRHGKAQHVSEFEAFRRIAVCAFESDASPQRHGDVAERQPLGQSKTDEGDWLTVAEAAALAGLSRRQVQRVARTLLSPTGAARRVGTAWSVERAALVAYLAERAEDNAA